MGIKGPHMAKKLGNQLGNFIIIRSDLNGEKCMTKRKQIYMIRLEVQVCLEKYQRKKSRNDFKDE